MKHRIITISREFGSGGRTIGKQLARKLNIPCYDEDLIDRLADESALSRDYVREYSEYSPQGFLDSLRCRTVGLTGPDRLWVLQKKVIRDLAQQGSCVLVGHCADYILRDLADCLNAFIHADIEQRARRIVQVYGDTDVAPRERLLLKDHRRAAYCKFYTDMEWGDMRNYHITLDSGVLGIDRCVDVLSSLY